MPSHIRLIIFIAGSLLLLSGIFMSLKGSSNDNQEPTTAGESLAVVELIMSNHDEMPELEEPIVEPEIEAETGPRGLGQAEGAPGAETEMDVVRAGIDWTRAPEPRPEPVKSDDFDLFINVTPEFLIWAFDAMGYTGELIKSGQTTAIPPLIAISIPKGWAEDKTVQFKKSMFYRVILPLILYENQSVLAERLQLLEFTKAKRNQSPLKQEQIDWIRDLAIKYLVLKAGDSKGLEMEDLEELARRVDMVSPSLALGQAAYESGYATSRFAHSGNALFGQWDWSSDSIKPQEQRKGKGNYGIKAFKYPVDSVRAYIWNLNTHYRYEDFRNLRSSLRGEQTGRISLDGHELAGTLQAYSERGDDYIKDLRGMMRYNNLEITDGLRLLQGTPVYFD